MKTITIPKSFGYPTVDITINGKEQTFASGVEIEVDDSVAEAIENAIALAPKVGKSRNKFAQLAEGSITEINAEDLEGVSLLIAYAFYDKIKLKKVTIPNSITTIRNGVFEWCVSLETVCLPEIPPSLENVTAFANINKNCVFYCKTQASLDAYKAAENWSTLTGTYSFVVEP